jgi:hypothetical protein
MDMDMSYVPALARSQVVPTIKPGYQGDYTVQVRRQDTTVEEVSMLQEFSDFTKQHFPKHQTQFIQVPEVKYLGKVRVAGKEGFPEKGLDKVDPVWLNDALGDQAEYAVFRAIQAELGDRPALSWNSFELKKLFFVAKEAMKQEREAARQENPDILEMSLTQRERELYNTLREDIKDLDKEVETVINFINSNAHNNTLDKILEKFIKSAAVKDKKDLEVVTKMLLRKIRNPKKPLSPNESEVKNFISYNLWSRKIERNQVVDQLVLEKMSSLFLQLEVKSVLREEGKYVDKGLRGEHFRASTVLLKGKDMFHNIIAPACKLSANWAFQGKPL